MRTGMDWDPWFLELCNTVAKKSQCLSRKIGSVLVKDNSVISTGYNGPPRGVKTCDERWCTDKALRERANFGNRFIDINGKFYKEHLEGKCPRYIPELGFKSGEGLDICVAGHSERNSLINAARLGIQTKGCKLYMNCGIPCHVCLTEIINAGIEEIIVTKFQYYDFSSEYLLKESVLSARIYEHLN